MPCDIFFIVHKLYGVVHCPIHLGFNEHDSQSSFDKVKNSTIWSEICFALEIGSHLTLPYLPFFDCSAITLPRRDLKMLWQTKLSAFNFFCRLSWLPFLDTLEMLLQYIYAKHFLSKLASEVYTFRLIGRTIFIIFDFLKILMIDIVLLHFQPKSPHGQSKSRFSYFFKKNLLHKPNC